MDIGFVTQYSAETVKFAGQAGFKCLEVFTEYGTPLDLELLGAGKLDEVKKVFRDNGVKVGTICCSINHLSGDPAIRKRNNGYFIKALKMCRKFGAETVTSNAWGDRNKTMEENLEVYGEVFGDYARIAEDEGVKIAIENCPHWIGEPLPSWNMAFGPEVWEAMFKAVPSKAIGLEFDPSHLVWQGIDYIQAIRDFGDRIYAFHAKDTEILAEKKATYGILGKQFNKTSEWDAGWWRYRIPGWGSIDWLGIFRTLFDVKFDGPMVIEHEDPVFDGDLREQGLMMGLRFLKQFLLD